MSMTLGGVAYADTLQDSITGSAKVALEAGSTTGATATIKVNGNNAQGDPDDGCNWDTGENPLVLTVITPAGVTASPNPLSFTTCGVDKTVTFTASASAVGGTATVSIASTPAGGGTYNNDVRIPIDVTQPANTQPSVTVTGVTDGASYAIGSVPGAVCSVTDAQDGPSSHPATLSAVTGPHATDGIGSRSANCSYTDTGGLTATPSSSTYSIFDPSAPVIGYTLNPTTADGSNSWYRNTVTLDWTVTEPDSPNSLTLTGCVDQTITADEFATDYSCSATSAGGSSGPVNVNVKRDGNGPAVTYTSASGTEGNLGWFRSPVIATFTATDGISGPATQTGTNASGGDGAAVTIPSPAFSDNAGNTTTAGTVSSPAFKIDTVAPAVGEAELSGTLGNDNWYTTPVSASFGATDGTSGVAGTNPKTVSTGTQQGEAIVLESPAFSDVAGNTTAAGAKKAVVKVDSLAPDAPTASLSPAHNKAGWNNSDVTVSFTGNGDNDGSGVDFCTADVPVIAETDSQTVSGTCTDLAGNVSDATQVTVKLDRTGPVISNTVTVTGTDGLDGWYKSPVEVTFTATDTLSGPASATQTVTSSGDGEAVDVASPAFTDTADNTTLAGAVTKTYKIDTVAPAVGEAELSGTLGSHGWYRSDVTASFTASDATSGVAGPVTQTVSSGTQQGEAIVLESPAFSDVAGNITHAGNKSATVKVDSIAPNAPTATLTPAPNGAGWNKGDVTVTFSGNGDSDGSGVDTCTTAVPVTVETAGQTVSGTCTDLAGNVSDATQVTVKLDKAGPVISDTVTVTGTDGLDGWYKSPVEVTFTGTDALSGAASTSKTVTSSGEGSAVQVASPAFTDTADNTTPAGAVTKTYKIDTVAPSVGDPALSGTLGANGWYRSAVTASFTATDATSGVAGDNPRTATSSQQGPGIVLSSPAFSDNAGNTTAAGSKEVTVKVDSSGPTVSLQGGMTGGAYYFGYVPASPTCTASDATPGSGLADADLTATGDQDCVVTGYGTGLGGHTVTATATDNAGNISTETYRYSVLAWTTKGFYSPVDMPSLLNPTPMNTVKGGSTVPLKFELFAGTTELTNVADIASFKTQKTSCSSGALEDAIEFVTTGGTSLRYDATGGQFIQNWKTPTGANTCYTATMTARDGSTISAYFKIK